MTKLPLFILLLSRQSLGLAALTANPIQSDVENIDSSMSMEIPLVRRTADLKQIYSHNVS